MAVLYSGANNNGVSDPIASQLHMDFQVRWCGWWWEVRMWKGERKNRGGTNCTPMAVTGCYAGSYLPLFSLPYSSQTYCMPAKWLV